MLISNMSSRTSHLIWNSNHNQDSLMVCQFVWTRVAAWSLDWMHLDSVFYIQVWFVAGAECSPALSDMALSSCVVPAAHYFTVSRRRLHSALLWWKAPSSTCFLTPVGALFINRRRLMSWGVFKIRCKLNCGLVLSFIGETSSDAWPTLTLYSWNNGQRQPRSRLRFSLSFVDRFRSFHIVHAML